MSSRLRKIWLQFLLFLGQNESFGFVSFLGSKNLESRCPEYHFTLGVELFSNSSLVICVKKTDLHPLWLRSSTLSAEKSKLLTKYALTHSTVSPHAARPPCCDPSPARRVDDKFTHKHTIVLKSPNICSIIYICYILLVILSDCQIGLHFTHVFTPFDRVKISHDAADMALSMSKRYWCNGIK